MQYHFLQNKKNNLVCQIHVKEFNAHNNLHVHTHTHVTACNHTDPDHMHTSNNAYTTNTHIVCQHVYVCVCVCISKYYTREKIPTAIARTSCDYDAIQPTYVDSKHLDAVVVLLDYDCSRAHANTLNGSQEKLN